ncbi:hypothetical protein N7530_012727 [Penicillium desertorum]|uniref:Uncharacterized protein n=1 Tax=Penicillium desertorum TaxID=1303715 RepID=A0A9X0BFQ0_9EURO|nr:hypothetical protein N7530_012727 [Penicillium desertorum]
MITLPTEIILMIVDAIDELKDRRKLLQLKPVACQGLLQVTLDIHESLVPLAHAARLNRPLGATIHELRISPLL